jgi:uncharacterized membrane protein
VDFLLGLVALGFAVAAYRRTRGPAEAVQLRERVGNLELQLELLRLELRALRGDAETAVAVPAAPPRASESTAPPAPPPRRPEPPREPIAPPPEPPRRAAPAIDLEQWLGVRGAAAAGGIVLALAGVFFLRHAIEQGWIPPWLRVLISTGVGVACLVISERPSARTRYERVANALAGAGIVILYASFWAALVLYELIPMGLAFAGMIAVTASCGVLAFRRSSLMIAALGLAGGFATPLLLSAGADHPIGLFGYLLLLNLALLGLARARGWPWLSVGALLATAAYQILWIGWRMTPERLWIGLVVLGLFGALFSALGLRSSDRAQRELRVTQAAGVLFPFAMAIHLAVRADLPPRLWPLALLLVPLSAASAWTARVQQRPWIAAGAASASLAVVAAWALGNFLDTQLAWETALSSLALALVFHVSVERDREASFEAGPGLAAAASSLGLFAVSFAAALRHDAHALAPWLVAWLGLAALTLRHGTFAGRGGLQPTAALLLAFALAIAGARHAEALGSARFLALQLAVALALQGFALSQRGLASLRWSEHAAAAFAVATAVLMTPVFTYPNLAWPLAHGAPLALGVLALLSATRLGGGLWMAAALAAVAGAQGVWTLSVRGLPQLPGAVFAAQLGSLLVFAAWPYLAGERIARERSATRSSALAALVWFPSLFTLWQSLFGKDMDGLLAAGLAGLGVAAAAHVQRRWPRGDTARLRALVWQLGVALAFATAAIPLQLEREWITIGWALEGLALVWLWQRLDHPGPKWIGLALLAAISVRLIGNPALLDYHAPSGRPILNWLLYTYLVPAAALIGAAGLLAPLELARARARERWLYASEQPIGALFAGSAALLVIFVWINLSILDAFATDRALSLDFERQPARDLTTSIAWAAYALVLLGFGVRRASRGLRWASLALLVTTIAKVFLHDLGELEDLYRVASLLGLALSLIAVSLAYQRFVFRSERPAAAGGAR